MISKTDFRNAISIAEKKLNQVSLEPRVFTLSIKKRFDGMPLIDVFSQSFPHVERPFWESKIDSGNLTLDGNKTSVNQIVKAGQITQHSVPPKEEPRISFEIGLIAVTNDYLVINKPSPLPVHAGGRYQKNTLTNILKIAFPNQNIHLINRLDANTTGVVLVALNKEVSHKLAKQFENREVVKTYLALVEGVPGTVMFHSSKSISKTKTPAGGRKLEEGHESNTDFELLKRFGDKSVLKVTPHSGRTNQIRLHLAGLGLPIVGDLGYKNPEYFENNPLTYEDDTLFLHAWKLEITDPISNKKVVFEVAPNEKWNIYL